MEAAMKVSKQQAAANRGRILAEAGRLFRERGLAGVGVDALAEAAGLSHGALYSRFGSKEQLAAEALAEVLARSAEALLPQDGSPQDATLETLVGSLVLARAVDDPALSDRILAAGRAHLSPGGDAA